MIQVKKTDSGIEVVTPYNSNFVSDLKKSISGAKWNGSAWIVPVQAEAAIMNMLKEFYGYDPAEKFVTVKITAKKELRGPRENVYFKGFPIAHARGRDSGAKVSDGVIKLSGTITSGGSVKNWDTVVREGASFQVSIPVSQAIETDEWAVEKIETVIDKADLIAERERLMARIAEINRMMEE